MHPSAIQPEPFGELMAVAGGYDPGRRGSRAWIAEKARMLVAAVLIVWPLVAVGSVRHSHGPAWNNRIEELLNGGDCIYPLTSLVDRFFDR